MTSEEDTANAVRTQAEVERARQFYAVAESARYLEPAPPTRLEWRRALLVLLEVEKVVRRAHDMLIAEEEIRLRDQLGVGLQAQLNRIRERINEVRAILMAEQL